MAKSASEGVIPDDFKGPFQGEKDIGGLLCAENFKYVSQLNPINHEPCKVAAVVPIFQMRKLRLTELVPESRCVT